jgi:hypothetical protein
MAYVVPSEIYITTIRILGIGLFHYHFRACYHRRYYYSERDEH